ncbi:ATP-binding cassette domain-containing protein [Streptomyces sp. p1417]|uniref:ATP-binding cassette domain-containing protein n=1 Tax=Streptomyces typhae TaxID=2681492 RepID=A0A6L6WUT0_9ACTN|nr:ABC transporter ATP-binding protein [Streptomyces typhae]MVO85268.1 ATP-binding cassette domain-containing protein [Streptomyces typhae]
MTAPPTSGVPALIRQLPRVARGLTLVLGLLILAQTAGSALLPLATGHLVAALTGTPKSVDGMTVGLVLLGLVLVLDVVLDPVRTMVAARLGTALDGDTAQRTVDGALRPAQIDHLDDPGVADRIERARAVGLGAHPPSQAVIALAGLVPLRLTGLVSAVLLGWAGQWWMPLVLGAGWVVTGRWQEKEIGRSVSAHAGHTAQLRRAAYLRELATTAPAAKEIRLFGMRSWLVDRFSTAWWDGMVQLRRGRVSPRRHALAVLLLLAAHLAVVLPLAYSATRGSLSVQHLTVALQALLGMFALGFSGDLQWTLHTASAAVPAALRVGDLESGAPPGRRAATDLPRRDIRFEKVGFAYPGGGTRVLDDLDLVVPAGSSLAILGDNGAGKSTLTKLLAGLYLPDAGRVTVDGQDLAGLDPADWRRQVAVVFQDFVRYPFSVRDNVGFGHIEADVTEEDLAAVTRLGGFAGVERELPGGWDTPLSGTYTDGTELSGGQWQRLALSRALFAVRNGARVLVLDEPTAHLDVEAEHELYARFLEITAGLTTVLVSHRFATVRLADRIAVVDGGRISEYGTHDELIAAQGRYARMFRVQSAPFAQPSTTEQSALCVRSAPSERSAPSVQSAPSERSAPSVRSAPSEQSAPFDARQGSHHG